jgi:hypothetical protein
MRQFYPALLLKWAGWVLGGLLAAGAAQAQAPDTLGAPRPRAGRWVPSIGLDNRNPLEAAAAVRVIGLNVGLLRRDAPYRVGFTAYTLRRDYNQLYTYSGKGKNQKVKAIYSPQLALLYFTPNFTYTFLRRRFIELSVPVDMGVGRSHYTVTSEKGTLLTDQRGVFVPAEIGLGVLLKPTRWVGLSGGFGYRRSLTRMDYEDDFNGWYYSYRLNFFLGPIWHDARGYCRRRATWRRAHPAPAEPALLPQEIGNP